MSFNYNPQDKIDNGGKAEPGTYPFTVSQVDETTFKSGNEGWKVQLAVQAFAERDITVFVNLVNTPSALWKMEEFCACLGFDFNNPPPGGWQPRQFEGKSGEALFKKPDKYLEVDMFIAASANNGPDAQRSATKSAPQTQGGEFNYGPPPMDSDNVPF